MNTKIILSVLFILLLPIVYSQAVLIDSENFDNYSQYIAGVNIFNVRDLLANESAGKWNCTQSSSNPNCNFVYGTGADSANYSIDSWGYSYTNNYLRLWSLGKRTTGNYIHEGLWWNHADFATTATSNFTLQFKVRYYNWMDYPSDNAPITQNYGGILVKQIKGITSQGWGITSGRVNGNLSEEGFNHMNQIRTWFDGALSQPATDTGCYITDGVIHEITIIYLNSSVSTAKYANVYVDGIHCIINQSVTFAGGNLIGTEIMAANNYDFGIDDLKIYNGVVYPSEITGTQPTENFGYCPITSCLFFDDFNLYASNYTSNFSVVHPTAPNDHEWTYAEGLVNIIGETLYLNSSVWGTQGRNADFTNTLPSHTQYDSIVSVIQFAINGSTPTPATMRDEWVTYRFNTYCSNNIQMFSIPVYFVRNDEWTLSENRTAINVYVLENGLRLLGTMTLDNDQSFYIKTQYDYLTGNTKILLVRDEDVTDFETDDFMFISPMLQNCRIASFTIQRGDVQNPENHFIGIDKVYFYGISRQTTVNGSYLYANTTDFNNSIVKTDIGEEVKNAINSFGIRTTLSKILLWAVISIAILISIVKGGMPDTAKLYALIVSQFALTIVFYYFEIIPTTLFVVIVFVYAIGAAFALYNIFGAKQGA